MNARCKITALVALTLAPVLVRSAEPGRTLDDLLKEKSSPSYEGEAVRHHMYAHPEPGSDPHRQPKTQHKLLAITWFLRSGISALYYEVSPTGKWYSVRDVYNWARQSSERGQLDDDTVVYLQRLLPKLPKSTAKFPIERTVVITFEQDGKWRREVYDSADLPETFEKVIYVVGERFETKDRKHKSR
jgi:hypothetical protein